MSSPLSLGGEHRADGHALAATLQTHSRGTSTQVCDGHSTKKWHSSCDPGEDPNALCFLPEGLSQTEAPTASRGKTAWIFGGEKPA